MDETVWERYLSAIFHTVMGSLIFFLSIYFIYLIVSLF